MTTDERVSGKPKVRVLWISLLFCHAGNTSQTSFPREAKFQGFVPIAYSLLAGLRWSTSAHLFTRLLPAGSLCSSWLARMTPKVSLFAGNHPWGPSPFPLSLSVTLKHVFTLTFFRKERRMVKKYGDTRKKMNVDAEVMNSIFYNGKVLKLE